MEEHCAGIVVREKPEELSWDVIHDVLWAAHRENREQGLAMLYPSLPGSAIETLLKEGDGKCFVALKDGEVVGTCAYKYQNRNHWFSKGKKTVYYLLEGVLPGCQGMGIYSKMVDYRDSHIDHMDVDVIETETAHRNKHMLRIMRRNGFVPVGYKTASTGRFYYEILARWPKGCPHAAWYCRLRYLLMKAKIRLRYKPGNRKRFGI